ncbi:hypothetical protein [Nocardioides hwasunensis]|uniref:PE domain-containing protein n=1 Tax=Nocardioides hwasunensis TaxID=397258 RepID=A0ABR8MQD3_9ACTN|nr:hypothetical protein [Nocardioides hwasunensis]MBD3916769.1 hypothetical protein [Nocardioides hwasunensis]
MGDPLVWQMETLRRGTTAWESQEELMDATARALGGASSAALPPSVQAAATSFLTGWAGHAGESAEIARGFVGALQATADDYSTSEDAVDRQFSDLGARLGPAR